MTISSNAGFLDVTGQDQASTFNLTCIVRNTQKLDTAKCIGHGVNHESGLRFVYESTMTLTGDAKIGEKWQARAWNSRGNKIELIKGSTDFARLMLKDR